MGKDNETSRYFTLVIYPEEITKDAVERLRGLGCIYISPIHNQKLVEPYGYIGEFKPTYFVRT